MAPGCPVGYAIRPALGPAWRSAWAPLRARVCAGAGLGSRRGRPARRTSMRGRVRWSPPPGGRKAAPTTAARGRRAAAGARGRQRWQAWTVSPWAETLRRGGARLAAPWRPPPADAPATKRAPRAARLLGVVPATKRRAPSGPARLLLARGLTRLPVRCRWGYTHCGESLGGARREVHDASRSEPGRRARCCSRSPLRERSPRAPGGAAAGAGDRRRRRPPQPAHGCPAGRGLRGARGGRPRTRRGSPAPRTAGSRSSCWTWGWCGPPGASWRTGPAGGPAPTPRSSSSARKT